MKEHLPIGPTLWTPPARRSADSRLGRWLAELRQAGVVAPDAGYDELWSWSVRRPEEFWPAVGAASGMRWHREPDRIVVPGEGMWDTRWFAGGECNYADMALHPPGVADHTPAVVARADGRADVELTFGQLRARVAEVAGAFRDAGVGRGDRVAGYLPNSVEALVAFLAAASLGAVWTCCASETGVAGVLDRLAQVSPTVLVAADAYRYGERQVDRRDEIAAVRAGLPSVSLAVHIGPGATPPGWTAWTDLAGVPVAPVPLRADHPLYVLYSSGTTGKPKAIVHGHGGIAAEHTKTLAMHFDLGAGDRFAWYTTTGWMMWNFLLSGLLVGATVVLLDGHPDGVWDLFADAAVTCGGVGAALLVAAERSGRSPGTTHDLSALRTLGSTGSPLPASTAAWVYGAVGSEVALGSFSGGTDVCTGFVGPSPLHPVVAGEISCRCLGASVEVLDDEGRAVIDREGELVLGAAMPSMPLGFWGDADRSRYRAAYFERFPGRWAHGDRATLTSRGTLRITGRSDGTLNRGGVRMGTAEFYDVVEAVEGVRDALVVHVEDGDDLWLFVVTDDGRLSHDLVGSLTDALRRSLSARHVPDHIVAVPTVPRTLSGKKLEVPVKRILAGAQPDDVVTTASLADPSSLDAFVALRPDRRG